ncbi:MAG: Ig-like domain-containing protein [Deltaproteobacteria bacterium]|nr:Ig-like domain-containing protein [Deltaproteobacteria bacterium]
MKRLHGIVILAVFSLTLGFVGACSDDDSSSGQVCGNDKIEGTEQCDGTDLGGKNCTDVGSFTGGQLGCTQYCTYDTSNCTGGANCGNGTVDAGEDCDGTNLDSKTCADAGKFVGGTLSCNANCHFDTSLCQAGENCGNGLVDQGEECDSTNLDSKTCADVGAFGGGTLSCAGDCTFDTTLCEASNPCGNGLIDQGEECDGTNLNDTTCADIGTFQSGDLSCADDCTFITTACSTDPDPSQQIAAARATADGTGLSLPIDGAVVTMTVPAVETSPAGFFIQAAQTGPALFVAVDPATLNPVPVAGDTVSFTITGMATIYGLRQATELSNFSVDSSGFGVSTLYQDVNQATDLVTNLDGYESEVISLSATVTDDFAFAGTGFVSATIDSAGMTGDPNLFLRMPVTLQDSLDLENGCSLDIVGTPMWRYNTEAQVGLWHALNATVTSCPAPQVVSATATSSTTVVITMNRMMDGTSITNAATQITFDNGLTASAASVSGRTITVTTSAQTGGTSYTVTVANSVKDSMGTGVDTNANSTTFLGYVVRAVVMINEFNANITGGCDLVELRVVSGGSMDGYMLKERTSRLLTFSGLLVATNDYIIVHFDKNDASCNPSGADNETTSKNQYPMATYTANMDTVWDWYTTDNGMTRTNNVLTLLDNQAEIMDAVLACDASDSGSCTGYNSAGTSESAAAPVAAANQWEQSGGGVPAGGFVDVDFCLNAAYDLDGTGTDRSGESIGRNSNTDTNKAGDWSQGASTWGMNNAGQTDF